jgi:DNA-binding transcriptional LysR family regulator
VLPLRTDRVVALVARGHRWTDRKAVTLRDAADEPLIAREAGSATRSAFEHAARAAQVQVRTALELGSREAVREAVAAGLGFGVVSEAEVGHDPRVRAVPLRPVVKTREYLVCLEERARTRLIRTVFEIASGVVAAGVSGRPG